MTDTDVFSGHAEGQITESLCSLGSLGRSVCLSWVFALTALPGLTTEVPGEHFFFVKSSLNSRNKVAS